MQAATVRASFVLCAEEKLHASNKKEADKRRADPRVRFIVLLSSYECEGESNRDSPDPDKNVLRETRPWSDERHEDTCSLKAIRARSISTCIRAAISVLTR